MGMPGGSDAVPSGDQRRVTRLKKVSRGIAALLAVLGSTVLCGWLFRIPVLISLSPHYAPMKPNTAFGFLCTGGALWLLHSESASKQRIGRGLSWVVLCLGALTLAEYIFGWELGIDRALYSGAALGRWPLRMSISAATHFTLIGSALLLLDTRLGRQRPSEWLALPVGLSSFAALLGYLYGVDSLYAIRPYSSMALHTAVAFQCCSFGLLFARPDLGLMRIVSSSGPGGQLARRLLPPIALLPIFFGWLRVNGQPAEQLGTGFGNAVFVASCVLCLASLVVATAKALHDSDRERRQAERKLQESEDNLAITLKSIGDGVITTDLAGRITSMNPVALELTGWPLREALGKPLSSVFQIVDEHSRETVPTPIEHILREGANGSRSRRIVLVARNGSTRAIADSGAPIRDARGAVRGVVLVFRDQTDERQLRQTEEQLRQSQKMEAIGTLAGSVAHDFNNLLSVIISYSDLLIEGMPSNDPMRADLQQIARAGQRAGDLTRQLLAFSRQQVLQPKVVNINEAIAGMAKMLARLIGEDIELSLLPGRGRGTVFVDPTQIEQVVLNLVVNARDAMPRGGKLTIESSDVDLDQSYASEHLGVKPGPYVMLSVSDTGAGMDPATQSRIFEPFFTTKERGKGTGLGLSTVFGIVKQSGGSIWVYSEPGEGTSFKIYLPRAIESEQSQERTSILPHTLRGTETILLTEDEEQVRALACAILRKHGYHVIDAASAGDALLICEQFKGAIHLLLTDVVMPRIGGRQLWERLSPLRPGMKVLFMSGYTDDAIIHHGVLSSEFAFVQKPLLPLVLLTKLRSVLDNQRTSVPPPSAHSPFGEAKVPPHHE